MKAGSSQFGAWRAWIGLALLVLGALQPGQAQPSAGAVQAGAGRLISVAADALGDAAARRGAAAFQAVQAGTYFAGEQSRDPAQAITEAGRVYRWRFDPAAGTALREGEQHFPGGVIFWTRAVVTPEGGWSVDRVRWRTGTDLEREDAAEALKDRLQWERYFAHLLVRQAEAAGTSQTLGENGFRYVDGAGATVEVSLDPETGRPARATFPAPAGPPLEVSYLDYRRWHGVLFAGRVQVRQGGRIIEDLRLADIRPDRLGAADLTPPSGYVAAPPPGEPRLREMSPGIFLFENMPADYHAMAIDVGDHLVLVEAPLSPAYAEQQRRLLASARPGKPVRAVLVTHHHGDHNGGLAVWAEAGATIMAPRGAAVAIERQLRGRGYVGSLRIEEVDGRATLGSGGTRIDAYTFSSSHAQAHLYVHVPAARLLFQGDLFYLPARGGPPPAFPIVEELQEQIGRRGLRVERIAGVHGRPASLAEFRESIRLGRVARTPEP